MIADTHIHAWNLDKAEYSWLEGNNTLLNRTYRIDEIEDERKAFDITKGILVQAANNVEDTDWMLQIAKDTEWIAGVVGWLPLTNAAETEKLLTEKYLLNPYFKGIRHLIHDEADPTWLLQPEVLDSLQIIANKNIPYDVVGVLPAHIETVLTVAQKIPNLRMVFDHLNQPPMVSGERFGRWGSLMKEAAQHSNFYAKISGLGTTTQKNNHWSADDIAPYVEFVLTHFGVDRCFCGGDWPVSLLAGSYAHTWQQYTTLLAQLIEKEDAHKVFYTNASRFYGFE
jgi:L-fuconolactonase